MREGLTVSGLTTSSSIWVTAALGMGVGAGEYYLSVFATIIVLVVLTLFGYVQPLIDRYQKAIQLHITFIGIDHNMPESEELMRRYKLTFLKIREMKKDGNAFFHYEVWGPEKRLNSLLKDLQRNHKIRSFEY
jgi:putative Mg2+ transporter-C (MgtC) family protein